MLYDNSYVTFRAYFAEMSVYPPPGFVLIKKTFELSPATYIITLTHTDVTYSIQYVNLEVGTGFGRW